MKRPMAETSVSALRRRFVRAPEEISYSGTVAVNASVRALAGSLMERLLSAAYRALASSWANATVSVP
jgi:hypothetical protein